MWRTVATAASEAHPTLLTEQQLHEVFLLVVQQLIRRPSLATAGLQRSQVLLQPLPADGKRWAGPLFAETGNALVSAAYSGKLATSGGVTCWLSMMQQCSQLVGAVCPARSVSKW